MAESLLGTFFSVQLQPDSSLPMESRKTSFANGAKEKTLEKNRIAKRSGFTGETVKKTSDTKIVVRGYDSSDLFREDEFIQIRKIEREIADYLKEVERNHSKLFHK